MFPICSGKFAAVTISLAWLRYQTMPPVVLGKDDGVCAGLSCFCLSSVWNGQVLGEQVVQGEAEGGPSFPTAWSNLEQSTASGAPVVTLTH